MERRQTEFFGPDLGRGPFASQRLETAAVQIATALAQLRAPLLRSDTDILAHADFIRQLADRLAPDYAAFVAATVGSESSDTINTTLRLAVQSRSLLRIWLADSIGGGPSVLTPASVSFITGTVLQTVTSNLDYLVISSSTGLVNVNVNYSGSKTWYWGVSRGGSVFYTSGLFFS
ncbi:MAG: hypothetical protein U1D55_04435 [Phycisphaerae bacterium]